MKAEDRSRLRGSIFASYGRDWQDATEQFDAAAADRWGRAYTWYLRRWLPDRRDAAIADLACGQGRLLYRLKLRGYTNLSGVDIAPDQVALARQIVPSVEQADVLEWLALHPERFDCLVGLDIVEHFTREEPLRPSDPLRRHHPRVGLQRECIDPPAAACRVHRHRAARAGAGALGL